MDMADPTLTLETLGNTSDHVYESQPETLERNSSFAITGKHESRIPSPL